jgi:hypothetical protein
MQQAAQLRLLSDLKAIKSEVCNANILIASDTSTGSRHGLV